MRIQHLAVLAALLIITVTGSGCFGIYTTPPSSQPDKEISTRGLGEKAPTHIWLDGKALEDRQPVTLRSDTYRELAKKVNPAVVNIFTSQKVEAGIGIGLFAIPLPDSDLRAYSLGTGFIISEDGFLLTNYHVVKHADEISVFLHETNEVQPTTLIGVDPLTDIALLKINTNRKLPYLPLADSDRVEIGDPVIAVGNPFGLGHSLTTGVISAKDRIISPGTRRGNFEQYIQTSAQINPGNSGGPLINIYGEVVGINTAIIAQAQGIGFAIPANMVKELAPDLVRRGQVTRGYFGIAVLDLTPMMAQRFKIGEDKGVLIARIDREGPAYAAGLQKGDIILTLNGQAVDNARDCGRRISSFPPGTSVRVEVMREGKKATYTVTTES